MKRISILLFLSLCLISCKNAGVPDNINTILVEEGDTPEQIIAKAVATKPSARQLEAMDDEFIAFACIGPNTFTGREWGTGTEDPSVFDLKTLDTDQWCRVMKEAGTFSWNRNSQNSSANLNPSAKIYYTLDGSDTDENSIEYKGPFKFQNGTLKAVCILDGQCGQVHQSHIGYGRSDWKIDIKPHYTLIDCEFDNIINDPSRRLISIKEPVTARYLRMDVKQLEGDGDGFQSRDSEIEVF